MIAIAGKNSIATEVTKYILQLRPDSNVCIVINKTDDGNDGFQPSFKKFALLNGLKIINLEELYAIDNLPLPSLGFDRITKPEKFKSDKTFNIHFSKLPAYKGMYTSALPILHGETTTGVTFHRIDPGIDTGDIIAQYVFRIAPNETSRSLYHKYLEHGTNLIKSVIDNLLGGSFTSTTQPVIGSSYYSKAAIDYTNLSFNISSNTAWSISCQLRAFMFRE